MPEERLPITFTDFKEKLNEAIEYLKTPYPKILSPKAQYEPHSILENKIRVKDSKINGIVIRDLFIENLDIKMNLLDKGVLNIPGTVKNVNGMQLNTNITVGNIKISPETDSDNQNLKLNLIRSELTSWTLEKSDFSAMNVTIDIQIISPILNTGIKFIEKDNVALINNKFRQLEVMHNDNIKTSFVVNIKENHVIEDMLIDYKKTVGGAKLNLLFIKNTIGGQLNLIYPNKEYPIKHRIKVVDGNDMNSIRFTGSYPNIVAWGLQETIGSSFTKIKRNENIRKSREHIEDNKAEIMQLIRLANDKGDQVQAKTLEYHVAAFDDQLISLESTKYFFQEKIIMLIGRWFSRHGTSWAKPLVIAFSSSLLLAIIIQAVMCSGICVDPIASIRNLFYILFQFINPLGNPITISADLGYSYTSGGWPFIIILGLLLLGKLIYAICLYELFRAARRFTR